jgi:hypothetical protein
MHPKLRAAFEAEMAQADAARRAGSLDAAFRHLERAHVLGQQFVAPHVRSHLGMLRIGVARRDAREIAGQLVRVPAAVIASALGVAPNGNTGGANVGLLVSMEIPDDLKALIDAR